MIWDEWMSIINYFSYKSSWIELSLSMFNSAREEQPEIRLSCTKTSIKSNKLTIIKRVQIIIQLCQVCSFHKTKCIAVENFATVVVSRSAYNYLTYISPNSVILPKSRPTRPFSVSWFSNALRQKWGWNHIHQREYAHAKLRDMFWPWHCRQINDRSRLEWQRTDQFDSARENI